MRLKLILIILVILGLGVLIPLSAQDAPTTTPPLLTNTPTRSITPEESPTVEPSADDEWVTVELPERVTFDGQRFQIVGLQLERTDHTLNSVTISVQNISDLPASGTVWYLLAPPESDEPWNDAVYASPAQEIVDLTAQEVRSFTFAAPPAEVIGDVRVSAWVHQKEPGGASIHADGVGYDQTLTIAPDVFLQVAHVDYVPQDSGETLVFVTLRVRNFTDAVTEVAYSYTLARPDDETPWETGTFVLPFQPLLLLPRQELYITTRDLVTLPDDDLQVIGWLQQRVDGEMQFRNNDPYP